MDRRARARCVLLCEGFAAVAVQLAAVRTLAAGGGHVGGRRPAWWCARSWRAWRRATRRGDGPARAAGPASRPVWRRPPPSSDVGFVPAWYAALDRWTAVLPWQRRCWPLPARCSDAAWSASAWAPRGRGRRVGGAFGWSTAGNLAAALAVPFAAMRYGGVGWTTALAGAVARGRRRGRGRVGPGAGGRCGCGRPSAVAAALAVAAGAWGALHGDAARLRVRRGGGAGRAGGVGRRRDGRPRRPGPGRRATARAWAAAGGLPAGTVLAAGADAVRVGALREMRGGMRPGEAFAAVWRPVGRDGPALEDRLLANTVREVFALCEPLVDPLWRGLVCEGSDVDGEVDAYVDARTGAEVDAGWRLSGERARSAPDGAGGGRGR